MTRPARPKRKRSSPAPPESAAPPAQSAPAPSPARPPASRRRGKGSSTASPLPPPTATSTTEKSLPRDVGINLTKTKNLLPKPQARRVLKSYLTVNGFGKWAKLMYQEFLTVHIPHCIKQYQSIVATHEPTRSKHTVTLSNVRFGPPPPDAPDPYSCRLNKRTYAVPLIVDVTYKREPLTGAELAHVSEQNANNRRRRGLASAAGNDATVLPLENATETVFHSVQIDSVPLMVNSEFCAWQQSLYPESCDTDPLDPGGYYVVDGSEKIAIGQESMLTNYPMACYKKSKGAFICEVRSNCDLRLRSSSTFYVQVVPAIPLPQLPTTRSRVNAGCQVNFCLPYCKFLPVALLFKALDVPDIDAMLDYICRPDCDPPWFRSATAAALLHNMTAFHCTKAEAMARIKADRTFIDDESMLRTVNDLLNKEFLPHQGTTSDAMPAKLVLFGEYVRKTLRVYFKLQPQDDREHYKYRRNISTFLMSMLFRDSYVQWCRQMQKRMQSDLNENVRVLDVLPMLAATGISRKLRTAIRTGNYTIRQGKTGGVSNAGQALSRIEPYAAIGQVLRTNSHGETVQACMMHESYIGVMDPYDTPDGLGVGQTRNMAAYAGVRAGHMTNELCTLVTGALGPLLLSLDAREHYLVSVSGRLIGRVRDPWAARELLRTFREARDMPADVSLFVDSSCNNTLVIDGDMGAFYWPLLRVDRLHLLPSILATTQTPFLWDELLNRGVAELVTKAEEYEHVRVAFYDFEVDDPSELPGVTHMVIDHSQIYSVYGQKGVNPEFNQGPRISYADGMRKQTAGRPPTAPSVDTCLNSQDYPQRKLVTNTFDTIDVHDEVSGSTQLCHVAIMCDPYNIEDALVVSKAAIDRGLFNITQRHTVSEQCAVRDTEAEQIGVPPEGTVSRVVGNFGKLNPKTGVVDVGAFVTNKDILVGKYAQVGLRQSKTLAPVYSDRSLLSKYSGQVERVHWYTTPQGHPAVAVTLRCLKRAEVGDKVASEHAQKTSIARIVSPEDMPFVVNGPPIDIVMNPHAIPSRMTIGNLIEILQTLVVAGTGELLDAGPGATSEPYIQEDSNRAALIDDLLQRVRDLGFLPCDSEGKMRVMLGTTGELVECAVFAGMQSVMRLKHMVNDKYHARWHGPTDPKTRQPVDGRGKEGGLRVGEMERDCMLAHGAAHVLKDRLCDSSDATRVDVCSRCGHITHGGERADGVHSLCRNCVTYTGVPATVPYAAMLNQAELQAMHVTMALSV